MTTLDFGKRYANGKDSWKPIQGSIIHKNPLMDKKLSVFQKLGYDGNVGFWQTICHWKGLKQTYQMSYCLQKNQLREKISKRIRKK